MAVRRPMLAAMPTTRAVAPDAALEPADMDPPAWLMGVKDIDPNPGYGIISGSRATGYAGGVVCDSPGCLALVKMSGRFIPESESMVGAYIALTSRAAGLKCEGEIRAGHVRWTCPRCRTYRQLALEVESREPEFCAVFVRRAERGA